MGVAVSAGSVFENAVLKISSARLASLAMMWRTS
jgi:hypothetical protein